MSEESKRVLIVSANPVKTAALQLEKEIRDIRESLRLAKERDSFEIRTSGATTINIFERELMEYKPNILHFCGHGTDTSEIVFEDETGNPFFVNGKALAGLLRLFNNDLECVVLNACFSEKEANEISNYISYVVGMEDSICDTAAIEFSSSFYRAVFSNKEYDDAFLLACAHLNMKNITENEIQPKLFKKKDDVDININDSKQKREIINRYLLKLKKGCEDKLKEIKSGVYNLSGNVYKTEEKAISGADDFVLHVDYLTTDENGETKEKTDDICKCINESGKKVVLLGEPGSGKSVSLLKLTIDFAEKALKDEKALIPILIPLGSYKENVSPELYIKKRIAIDTDCFDDIFDVNNCMFVFDALNETATSKQENVITYIKGLEHYIVSCRVLDYKKEFSKEKDVSRIEILDLDLKQIENAIKNNSCGDNDGLWYDIGGNEHLLSFWENLKLDKKEKYFWQSPSSLKKETVDLLRENYDTCDIESWIEMHNKGLLPMCRNPMLLKMVYDLYTDSDSDLPKNRGRLFESFAERCIGDEIKKIKKREEKSDSELEKLKKDTFDFLICLANIIIINQQGTGIEYQQGRQALSSYFEDMEIDEIEKFAHDAGILISNNDEYRFIHQLHQEYFASGSLQKAFDNKESSSKFFNKDSWWEPCGWEEPAVILAGILTDDKLNDFLLWLSDVQPKLVIRCIENAGISGLSINSLNKDVKNILLEKWLDKLKCQENSVKSHIYIGQAIDKIGDTRCGIGVEKIKDHNVPKIEWIQMNNSSLYISKYPITVCQYASFLEDENGYKDDQCWSSTCESQAWHRQRRALPAVPKRNNAPMVNVSWYDAVAFCNWLEKKCNERIRLPFEEEWMTCFEKNVTGTSAVTREDLIELDDSEKYVSVGLFDENEGTLSDIGLVWEWCFDQFGDKPNLWGGINPESNPTRILKGGSWLSSHNAKSVDYRMRTYASHIGIDIGFRIVKVSNNY